MRWFILIAGWIAVTVMTQSGVNAAEGRALRVLYVGPDPNAKVEAPWYVEAQGFDRGWAKLVLERMPAFERLLKEHFDEVQTVPVKEYKASMSDDYDVTILDAMPEPIETRKENGREIKLRLPEDFNRPTITINDVGPMMLGRNGYGWKIDHLCQCLDYHAHGFDTGHPLFCTPHPVTPTMEERFVPSSFRWSESARDLGKMMPMWRVEIEGDQRGVLIGCVSMPELNDSPDGEALAGGECMKGVDAVAIGRQGNFLHWGFAASPTYMTDEAKLVFINAVHYISRFEGQRPLVHRAKGIVTRSDMADKMYLLTEEGFKLLSKGYFGLSAEQIAEADELRAKKERGKDLTDDETTLVAQAKATLARRQQMLEYGVPKAVRERFGDDLQRYRDYYAENRDYLYPLPMEGYGRPLDADEDAKSLGIANNEVRLLDKCVDLLEAGEQVELAQRVLERYTEESFDAPDEWRQWLDDNRDRLFFTEVGGFKFMAAPRELVHAERTASADDKVRPAITMEEEGVRWTAEVKPDVVRGSGPVKIVVQAHVARGWHIYAKSNAASPFAGTSIGVELPKGLQLKGGWDEPIPKSDPQTDATIYDGKASFSRSLEVDPFATGMQTIKLTIRYQACNDRECLPPAEKELLVNLEVD